MEQELYDKLKTEIKAELIEEIQQKDYRAGNDLSKPLGQVYTEYRKALYEKYGVYQWAKVWECIRGLAIRKAGCVYVRELKPETEEQAAAFAKKLCEEMLEIEKGESNESINGNSQNNE